MIGAVRHRYTSAAGVVASLVGGASLFLAFRLAIEVVGAQLVGGWALIQGVYFLSRVNDSGTGINITRMVSVNRSEQGSIPLIDLLAVGLLLSTAPVIVLGLALIFPANWLMVNYFHSALPPTTIFNLVLLSFGTAVLSSLAVLVLSVLEGAGGLFYRHIVTIVSNLVLGASAYPLLSRFGAEGLGLMYLAAAGALLVGGLMLLPFQVPAKIRSSTSKRQLLSSLWRENLSISAMALVRVTFEPWTKFLVGATAGVAAVASLDLAFRVTTQVRVALQAAMQPLLALGSRSIDSTADHFHPHYRRAHRLAVRVNICLAGVLVASGPFVGYLGFGSIPQDFLIFFTILVVANSVNAMGVVGYFFSISGGRSSLILKIHIVMMTINLILGFSVALAIGASAAVLVYMCSFAYGGFALAQPWMKASGENWGQLLRQERANLLLAVVAIGAVACAVAWLTAGSPKSTNNFVLAGASAATSLTLAAYFAAFNWRILR